MRFRKRSEMVMDDFIAFGHVIPTFPKAETEARRSPPPHTPDRRARCPPRRISLRRRAPRPLAASAQGRASPGSARCPRRVRPGPAFRNEVPTGVRADLARSVTGRPSRREVPRDGRFRFRFRFRASPALRIAVVGAGPCGLTTALALRHHGFDDVTVYDKFPEIKPALGAAFNLNGGAAVLDKLGCLEMFREHNNPMRVVRTRRVGNDALGQLELMNINIPDLIDGDDAARTGLVSPTDGDALCGTVMRCDLPRALGKAVPVESLMLGPEFEVVGVDTAVDPNTQAPVSTLRFANGTRSRPFDLVVGCDGINSRVRASMFGSYASKNSGIRIVFGCTGDGVVAEANEDARPESEHGEIHQWFGDGCYALVYTAGGFGSDAKQHNVAVCIADDADLDETSSGGGATGPSPPATRTRHSRARRRFDGRRRGKRQRKRRCTKKRARSVGGVVGVANVRDAHLGHDRRENRDRFFDVGVRYHDPLDEWSDPLGVLVLAGDACHAMPPFLGQGANQACRTRGFWRNSPPPCAAEEKTRRRKKAALRRYESIRKPPTTAIMLSARVIGGFVETGSGLVSNVRDAALGCWEAGDRGEDLPRRARCPC